MKLLKYPKLPPLILALCSIFCALLLVSGHAKALSGSEFSANNIIGDSVFFNPGSMSASDIQAFLNAKVPVCDTNGSQPSTHGGTRADWGHANGYDPPYTCLKDYTENIPSKSPDSYCSGSVSAGVKSAAQILVDVAQACGVSPKVLIVLLQKEQSLVTDDWPWSIQYRAATGYGCPDTASCDPQYYGFFNQVYYAARQYQRYSVQSNLFNFRKGVTSFVQYNPNAGCGGTNITMQNQATAGLYNYTPYQPNAAALNNLYGTGDSCSAYGNRNFWRLFSDWFGSTQTNIPFAWGYVGQQAYSDSGMTQPLDGWPTVTPGGTIYVKVQARNIGNQTWYQNVILGTTHPNNRTSVFADSSWWLNGSRPAHLLETSVGPGQTGTFAFAMKAPSSPGTYKEYFNPLIEGQTWFNDPGLFFTINVVSSASAPNSSNTRLSSGGVLHRGEYLLSPDTQSILMLQSDGSSLILYSDFKPVWSTSFPGKTINRVEVQGDGNVVLFATSDYSQGIGLGTEGHPGAHMDINTDGTVTVSDSGGTIKTFGTPHNPDRLSYVNPSSGTANMFLGQRLETADRRYRLVLQADGNLVLYSTNTSLHAIWTSQSAGRGGAFFAIQSDGNLVLYSANLTPLWSSNTIGGGSSQLVLQSDGNLVLYNSSNKPVWTSKTAGVM